MSRESVVKFLNENADSIQDANMRSVVFLAAKFIEEQLQDEIENEEFYQCRGC